MSIRRSIEPLKNWQLGSYSLLSYVFLTLFVLSVVSAVSYSIMRDREALIAMHAQRAVGNAQVFEDQISQTLQLIENTLRTLPEASETSLLQGKSADLQRLLSRLLHSQPAVRSLSIMTLKDGVRASSNPANIGKRIDLSDLLPLDMDTPDSLVLRLGRAWIGRDFVDGEPIAKLSSGRWDQAYFVPLALRLGSKDNAVWVIAALNPDHLLGQYDRYRQSDAEQFELVRLDGSVLVTTQNEPLGQLFQPAPLLARAQAEEFGLDMGEQAPQRLTAFRNSNRYPFFVAVHIEQSAALHAWLLKVRMIALGTALALLVVIAATLFLMRRIQRNELAKREHRRTIQTLSQAIEQNPSGVVITNTQGVIEYCNPFFRAISGLGADDLVGQFPQILKVSRGDADDYRQVVEEVNQGHVWSGEFLLQGPDDRDITVFAVISPLRDENGVITHQINVCHDISEQKKMQRALELARDRAQAATVAKSQFLANMSHEIRTPMNGVIGLTELALETSLDDIQRDYLNAVKNSALSLMDLLNEILDFSKVEAGKLEIESLAFSLDSLLTQTCADFRARAHKKGLGFECQLPDSLPRTVLGDPNRLRQVIRNLIDNAIKFTAEGSVHLSVELQAIDDKRDELCIRVRDTGIGIPEDKQQSVFEAFNQADTSTTRQYGGAGLGLAISARLVALMGGRIWLDSSKGEGSTFAFTVSLGRVDAHPVPVARGYIKTQIASESSDALRSLKVLLVEDNKVNQMLALTLLKRWGHQVDLAENGQQAVDQTLRCDYDVILMDLQMPVMGGLDAAKRIRASESSGPHHVPIIAVTANVQDADRQACRQAGMDDFLPKPLRAEQLQAILVKYCA